MESEWTSITTLKRGIRPEGLEECLNFTPGVGGGGVGVGELSNVWV